MFFPGRRVVRAAFFTSFEARAKVPPPPPTRPRFEPSTSYGAHRGGEVRGAPGRSGASGPDDPTEIEEAILEVEQDKSLSLPIRTYAAIHCRVCTPAPR